MYKTPSPFGSIDDILTDRYSSSDPSSSNDPSSSSSINSEYVDQEYICGNVDLRVIPSGRLPGSTILLTDGEKRELLLRFINNGPELI